jgi:hypothetical protein
VKDFDETAEGNEAPATAPKVYKRRKRAYEFIEEPVTPAVENLVQDEDFDIRITMRPGLNVSDADLQIRKSTVTTLAVSTAHYIDSLLSKGRALEQNWPLIKQNVIKLFDNLPALQQEEEPGEVQQEGGGILTRPEF